MTRFCRPKHRSLTSYWPHVGIGLGLVLNAAGLIFGEDRLIATGSNALTFCAWKLSQRRRGDSGVI
jgi:hypothetical protein